MEWGCVETLAGFKYHLYADNFKFISQLSLRPGALNSSIYLLISLGHPGMSQTQLGQTPNSAPIPGFPGLLSTWVPAPPLCHPGHSFSQHNQSTSCFLPCSLWLWSWPPPLISRPGSSATHCNPTQQQRCRLRLVNVGLRFSLPGQHEQSQASCHGWPDPCWLLLSLCWSFSSKHTSAPGPLHLWVPGLGMFLPQVFGWLVPCNHTEKLTWWEGLFSLPH